MKRRKPIRKQSDRGKLVKRVDALLFTLIKRERGERCQLCGRTTNLTPFHILPKGTYPKLRFNCRNILIACWFPCHNDWHSNYYKAKNIEKKIIKLLGEDYEVDLKMANECQQSFSPVYLKTLEQALKNELKGAKHGS